MKKSKHYLIFQISIKFLPSEISKIKKPTLFISPLISNTDGKLQEGDRNSGNLENLMLLSFSWII